MGLTFDQLWTAYLVKNPTLSSAEFAKMPVSQFKRAMEMAYDQGVAHEKGKVRPQSPTDKSVFEQIFGNSMQSPFGKSGI